MNSYWVEYTVSKKHCETTKSLKICYLGLSNISQEKVYRRTETTHQQWVGRSESRGYWMCWWRVALASPRLHSCWRRTFWTHPVIKMMWC